MFLNAPVAVLRVVSVCRHGPEQCSASESCKEFVTNSQHGAGSVVYGKGWCLGGERGREPMLRVQKASVTLSRCL